MIIKLAKAYVATEDWGKAITAYETALAADPTNAQIAYDLGKAYAEIENYKKAMATYQKAINLPGNKPIWTYELGLMYFESNDFPTAITLIQQAAEKGLPKDLTYYENLGMAQLGTKDFEKGIETLGEVLKKKPNDVQILDQIAQSYFQHGKWDKAIAGWDKVMIADDKNYKALYMTGMAYQRKGDIARGRSICDQAIAADPSLARLKQEKFNFQ